jgi:hypothetical protein
VLLSAFLLPAEVLGAGKAATCVKVQAPENEREGLERLVASEVDRHPLHRVATAQCAVHLLVEIIDVEGHRFVTGRIGGEVPERVRMERGGAKALETALVDLLRVVLESDPVSLRRPAGQSWFGDRALQLRDRGYSTLDVSLLQGFHAGGETPRFLPGVQLGYAREITSIQLAVEGVVMQSLTHPVDTLTMDTQVSLHLAASYFFSDTADVSAFTGFSLGLLHQRFHGPRSPRAGGGEGDYYTTGPAAGLRAGVELFRTTAIRALLFADGRFPLFAASDGETEVVDAWVPTLSLGAGVRF